MKKLFLTLTLLFFLTTNAFALSSMVVTRPIEHKTAVLVKVVCTGHTDGSWTPKVLTVAEMGGDYTKMGWRIGHAWVVNSATDNHTAETITITDDTGQQLIGSTVGDTLAISAVASAITYLSIDRGSAQRSVTGLLTITPSDASGAAAVVFTLYILLVR